MAEMCRFRSQTETLEYSFSQLLDTVDSQSIIQNLFDETEKEMGID